MMWLRCLIVFSVVLVCSTLEAQTKKQKEWMRRHPNAPQTKAYLRARHRIDVQQAKAIRLRMEIEKRKADNQLQSAKDDLNKDKGEAADYAKERKVLKVALDGWAFGLTESEFSEKNPEINIYDYRSRASIDGKKGESTEEVGDFITFRLLKYEIGTSMMDQSVVKFKVLLKLKGKAKEPFELDAIFSVLKIEDEWYVQAESAKAEVSTR